MYIQRHCRPNNVGVLPPLVLGELLFRGENVQQWRARALALLITLLTFATVLGTTVYTYLLKFEDRPASLTGMKALSSLNLLAPITVALLFSVRGWAGPSARWSALRFARAKIEGEIFRYRSAAGVYDPKARTTPSPPKTKARRGGGAKKAAASPASTGATQLKPRRLFAQRV